MRDLADPRAASSSGSPRPTIRWNVALVRRYRPGVPGARLIIDMPIGASVERDPEVLLVGSQRAADSACAVTSIAVPQRWVTAPDPLPTYVSPGSQVSARRRPAG